MNQDKINKLKRVIRRKVFSGSELLRKNNRDNLTVLPSEKYPTEIIRREGVKYLRINEKDIDDNIDNLFSIMLGMDEPNEENIEEEIKHSYKLNKELDGIKIDIPDDLSKLPIKLREVIENEHLDEEEKKEVNHTIDEDFNNTSLREAKESFDTILNSEQDIVNSKDKDQKNTTIESHEKLTEQTLQEIKQLDLNKVTSKFITNEVSEYLKNNIKLANKLSKQLVKALKGKNGKNKSINPSKRISSRDVILDRDKIYITKKMNQGKEIDMNLIIDMSGSMYGEPINNAILIIYIFNQLAKQGLVKMSVIYSNTEYREVLKLPCKDSEILSRSDVFNGEGLKESLDYYTDILKNKNLICITDGSLTDRPISQKFWRKHKIVSTGIYVRDVETEELIEYGKQLNEWFIHGLTRPNLDSLIQTLIRIGLK